MTKEDIVNLPKDTKVRIINCEDCHPAYKRGGTISFNDWSKHLDNSEDVEDLKEFGISIEDFGDGTAGVCYNFEASQYELVEEEGTYETILINELIDFYENPKGSNEAFKQAVISVARNDYGYGYKK